MLGQYQFPDSRLERCTRREHKEHLSDGITLVLRDMSFGIMCLKYVLNVQLEELRRISFLNEWVFNKNPRITLHDLYTYYARCLVKDKTKELLLLKEAKGPEPDNFRCSPAGNCWPRLRRVFLHGATFVGSVPKKVQEWRNVVVLELVECKHLRVLGLQGFNCLRSLTLARCEDLESVTCSCNPPADMSLLSQEKSRPVMDSCMPPLQHVVLFSMESLEQIPHAGT